MKILSSVLLLVLFTAVLAQNDDYSDTDTEATTLESTTTTFEPTTTTLESTSTTLVSTTTNNPSTTTATSTTPSSTTSSSPATTSSTGAPVPTSSPVTVTPTKAPQPDKCEFNVTEGNLTCIQAAIQADFIIEVDGTKYTVLLGCNASSSGSDCLSNETQTLILSESTYILTMVFEKGSGKVLVKNVTFSYNLPAGPRGTVFNYSEDLFSADAGKSYLCKSKLDIHLDNVTMEVHNIHIQAFLEEGKTYGAIQECEADEHVSDIVPIAVGVALAALIIIVLIAYLVGRRRSRQKGYQSV